MNSITYTEVLRQLVAIVEPHVPDITVTEQSRFGADLALPSLEVMDLVNEIEDHFELTIPMNDLPQLQTVGLTARYLTKLLGGSDSQ